MQKISASTTTANAAGEFTEGNPAAGVEATRLKAAWLNSLQRELVAVIESAGFDADPKTDTQLRDAIRQIVRAGAAPVGSMRNASMSVAAASASATFTADEVVLETALGGQPYRLAPFTQTINLGTVGAGGMDAGSAPATGYVALYAIYNPTTKSAAMLASNATSAKAPSVYGGSAMPAGYTASALVSVWPTNSTGQLSAGHQADRVIYTQINQVLNTSQGQSAWTPLNISAAVPINAREVSGMGFTNSTPNASLNSWAVAGNAAGVGGQASGSNSSGNQSNFARIPVMTPQMIYYQIYFGGSPVSAGFSISSYSI